MGNPSSLQGVQVVARMRPLMVRPLVLAAFVVMFGCGKEIGDSCVLSTDCDPNGNRFCDTDPVDGYCTILGCDYDTCPTEATCVQFFTGDFSNELCTQGQSPDGCDLDELCDLTGHCVPRDSEIRYCMRTCKSNGDCRSGYECRNYPLMITHGGEPVLAPGDIVDSSTPGFCALAPASN